MVLTSAFARVDDTQGVDNGEDLRTGQLTVHHVNMGTARSGVQLGPNATELSRYLDKGLTQAQVVEAWEAKTGIRVSRSTIGMAIARFGLESSKPRPRYEDTVPWKVAAKHRMHNDARMLRLEGRRRKGLAISAKNLRLLTHWREQLEEANAVVAYDPDTEEGFFWVHRKDSDDDIIRRGRV